MGTRKATGTNLGQTKEDTRFIGARVDRKTADLTVAAVRVLLGVSVAEWIRREANKVIEEAGLAKAQ